ncbi:MAG: adventurous gliding motility protein GltJ [Myxococcaceae bacterium]
MRFVCDSCRAQYMISDEKVGAKGVKVRCKKCGYVILVRRPDAAAPAAKPAQRKADQGLETQVMDNPLHGPSATLPETPEITNPGLPPTDAPESKGGQKNVMAGVDEDEIGAVFDQVLNSGQHKLPESPSNGGGNGQTGLGSDEDDRLSTRVIDADTVRKLAAESEAQAKGTEDKAKEKEKEKDKGEAAHDWFVAIDEKQSGPFSVEKLKDYWNRGEIGPDSLCWRAGFGDWMALSEVPELAAVLAPRPAKPVLVAPSPSSNIGQVVSVPVESAFSAGGMTKTVRSEVQVPIAASPSEDTSGWKPSAASALASLAKADIEALTKPKPKAPPPEPVAALEDLLEKPSSPSKSLLDLPVSEEKPQTNGKANGAAHAKEVPESRARPMSGATYTSPGFSTYKPQSKKGLIIGLSVGAGIVVLGLVTAIVYFATRQPVYPPPYYPQPGQGPPGQVAANPNVPPVRVVPPAAVPAAQVNPPVAPTGTQAAAPGAQAPALAPEKVEGTAVANTGQGVGRPKNTRLGSAGKTAREPSPPPAARVAAADPPPSKAPVEEPSGDDFDKEFGGGGSSSKPEKAAAKPAARSGSVYIPPAPGSGSAAASIPDSLGQSDIIGVVLSNKPALARCMDEQKKKDPGTSGKLVMRWTILPSGKTTAVSCRTDEFKTTYMASCLGGLIKGWSFPRHKQQGEPIEFPFKF